MQYLDCKQEFLSCVGSYCAEDTIMYYKVNFHVFEKFLLERYGNVDLDLCELHKSDFVLYVGYLRGQKIKNTSVRTYVRAMKVFFRYLFFEGYLHENITEHVRLPKSDKALIIPLSNVRVNTIVDGILKTRMPERNLCIFFLMLDCGLRLSEVVSLNVSDFNFTDRYISIVNSKNNKSRVVPLPEHVADLIRDYRALIGRASGALLLDFYGKERITRNAVKLFFSKLKKYDKDIHAHLLRHTFATSYIVGGGSLEYLRVLMGHESYNVTKEYLHIAAQMNLCRYDIYKLDKCMFLQYGTYEPVH